MRQNLKVAAVAAVAALVIAGCEQPVDTAQPATSDDTVVTTLKEACPAGREIQEVTPVTKKAGYGSRTAYLLVRCSGEHIVRVTLGDK